MLSLTASIYHSHSIFSFLAMDAWSFCRRFTRRHPAITLRLTTTSFLPTFGSCSSPQLPFELFSHFHHRLWLRSAMTSLPVTATTSLPASATPLNSPLPIPNVLRLQVHHFITKLTVYGKLNAATTDHERAALITELRADWSYIAALVR
jgi:hypothetical protein